ncbi:amino acid adenylation domain-containing protein [Brevibacillus antibioticus]|uniref:Amino acid adenylation domain-containing protein n=1 Tax=Brevibacillus antibioticus TaxID=2570228 RepID=A0A4U2Y3L7_9BACL|nr:type I polyketide synthase [Brevibacillus antibioticus]TKI55070.1 amino acid adenylation domain-containing protein [Brevibacillus antibioticus]
MKKLTQTIFEKTVSGKIDEQTGIELLTLLKQEEEAEAADDIAIIGMSALLPSASNAEQFWQNISQKKDCIIPFPQSRCDDSLPFLTTYTHVSPDSAEFQEGGFLDAIDKFDYKFFRLPPKEATLMDPHQRLFLQTAWEAIEDAGYGGRLTETKTGVYLGYANWPAYGQTISLYEPDLTSMVIPSNLPSNIAARISYLLNLKGPSMLIDTACSSSLVATHIACQALQRGECELAIVGGVKVNLYPVKGVLSAGIESDDFRTRTFDHQSSGTVWGEGSVALLLKPLRKALADRDMIHAVIKGSAINQDGNSVGISAPNMERQEQVIVSAWENAGIDPETITYIEAHGTATRLGDPIEVEAINRAFQRYTDKKQFCAIGSVKSNIGHLDYLSGMAGLVKSILALKHKKLPPTLHFTRPNANIPFEDSPVYINNMLREWETDKHPRRCGVSSFGFSGTNCHVVLEEAPVYPLESGRDEETVHLLTLSTKSETSLRRLVGHFQDYLYHADDVVLSDLCYTANTGREHYDYRLALVFSDQNDLQEKLQVIVDSPFEALDVADVYYRKIKRSTGKKEALEEGELSSQQMHDLTKALQQKLIDHRGAGLIDELFLHEVAISYIQGAQVDWEQLYLDKNPYKLNLPVYPFDRERCWFDFGSASYAAFTETAATVTSEGVRFASNQKSTSLKQVTLTGRKDNNYTVTEQFIGTIWGDVLGLDDINIHDSFYELGGDSVIAMNVIAAMERKIGKKLEMSGLFEKQTVHDYAAYLDEKGFGDSKLWEEASGTVSVEDPNPEDFDQTFPLSEVQMAYFIGRNDNFELGGVSTYSYLEIETEWDMERLNRSLQKIIDRHPMLRAVILNSGEQQFLRDCEPYYIEVQDISGLGQEEQLEVIERERQIRSHFVFDTERWPMFECKALKLSDKKHYLFVGFDALIVDGSSVQIICKELVEGYEQPEKELAPLSFTFRDYQMAYSKMKQSEPYLAHRAWWLNKLPDFPSAPKLPMKASLSSIQKPQFRRFRKMFSQKKWQQIRKLAQEKHVTPSVLLCSMYAEVLAFWSNQPKLAINLTLFNRLPFHPDVPNIVGDFTSLILLDVDTTSSDSFWERVMLVQSILMSSLEHRFYDGIEFIRDYVKYHNMEVGKAVMPYVFTSMLSNREGGDGYLSKLGTIKKGISQTPQVFLDNQASEMDGQLCITWDYVDQLFDEKLIAVMFDQYVSMIDSMAEKKDMPTLEISFADRQLIAEYNDTTEPIEPTTLHQLFIQQAKRVPQNIAAMDEYTQISYRELDERSNQVANALESQGVGLHDFVAISAERRVETVIHILGILKIGAAFVPIDPEYPAERRDYIYKYSNCIAMIDSTMDVSSFSNVYEPSADTFHVRNTAYVIHTSGSTGNPKGVVITHAAVTNTILDINQKFNVTDTDKLIGLSSFCFDLSVFDLFGALSAGASLYIVADSRDMSEMIRLMNHHQFTVWNSVPAFMDLLMEQVPDDFLNESLRVVMLSGDWIPAQLPARIVQKFTQAEVISLGGATEVSIWSIYYPIKDVKRHQLSIPYGYPLANQTLYVLNHRIDFCPVDVMGELYIGGVGLAEGYLNEMEKTNSAFIKHPTLGPLYRTGDYGILRREGYIEFLGRKDHQIKIRGFRIELGEIENSLLAYPGVQRAVVLVREEKGKKLLIAYFTASGKIPSADLKAFVANKLPEYMVPSGIVQLSEIPLSATGKVDRKLLQALEVSLDLGHTYTAPRNETEHQLVRIWQEILNVEKVGIQDNFFELGGDSLRLQRVKNRIENKFNLKISVSKLFEEPTVEGLAKYIFAMDVYDSIATPVQVQLEATASVQKANVEKANVYYWSPVVHWQRNGDTIKIGSYEVKDPALVQLLPEIYFLSQKGVTADSLNQIFNHLTQAALHDLMQELVDRRILINSLLTPMEIFATQETLFSHPYGEEILYDAQALESYKRNIQAKRTQVSTSEEIALTQTKPFPAYISNRKSHRVFETQEAIRWEDFSHALSILKQHQADPNIRYYYPSAGGMYPIDTYIYVKAGRVEGLAEGIYYFNPVRNSLQLVSNGKLEMEKMHYIGNKEIGLQSAFTVFFIYKPEANMPKYGFRGYYYAVLDTGVMSAMFAQAAELNGLGTCSIGDLDFDKIRKYFRLNDNQVFIHAIEGGLKAQQQSIRLLPKQEYYAVSSAQKRMYILNQLDQEALGYNTPAAMMLVGRLDRTRLEEAFEALVKRHEVLRTSFAFVDQEPVQIVHDSVSFQVGYVEAAEEETSLYEMIRQFIQPFNLVEAPLFRVQLVKVEEEKHLLFFDLHHIVTDWTSSGILLHEFATLYNGGELPALSVQYKEFSAWQNDQLENHPKLKQQEDYWMRLLEGELPVLQLPTDYPRPALQNYEGAQVRLFIDTSLVNGLKQISHETGSTLYMVLLAAVNVLLSKYSGLEDILICSPVSGREHADLESLPGIFVNTLVLRNEPRSALSFREFVVDLRGRVLEAMENQAYQFDSLVNKLDLARDTSRNPISDMMFIMRENWVTALQLHELQIQPYELELHISRFDLTFEAIEQADGIQLDLLYRRSLFEPATIEKMGHHFICILEQIVQNIQLPLSEISMLPKAEYQQLLTLHDTTIPYQRDKSIVQWFQEQVNRSPDRTAVIYEDHGMTYRELDERSSLLAKLLIAKGAGQDQIVGIMVEPTLDLMVGLFAILKAGGAYMPIDPAYPRERIEYMLQDSGAHVLLTQSCLLPNVHYAGDVLCLDDEKVFQKADELQYAWEPVAHDPDQTVYVIYTSGTTGNPKGVKVRHHSLVNLLTWFTEEFDINEQERILLISPIGFDLSVKNLFSALLKGGTLVIYPSGLYDYNTMSDTIAKQQITLINCTPSAFYPLIEFNKQNQFERIKSLRKVFLGGEPINCQFFIPWLESENCQSEIVNTYGPTECTDISAFHRLDKDKIYGSVTVPIGKPVYNTSLYIVDANNHLVPYGLLGELCIGGEMVSKGYHNKPELTAEKFVPNPFVPGTLMYKTGDLTRWLPDGSIDFIGRVDNQVKIRGYRIELGEVEKILLKHEKVKDAAVIVKQTQDDKYLRAFYISEESLSSHELRVYAQEQMPHYMVPRSFTLLEQLPLTPNGKVDKRTLGQFDEQAEMPQEGFAPKTDVEEHLFYVWKQLLNTPYIGVNDSFFDLGGDSLLVIRMHAMLEETYPGKLSVSDLFSYPTISRMAAFINQKAEQKSIQLQTMPLPADFLPKRQDNQEAKSLKVRVDEDTAGQVKTVAAKLGVVTPVQVMLVAYVMLLAEITSESYVAVQMMNGPDREVNQLTIRLAEVRELADLFTVMQNGSPYSMNEIKQLKPDHDEASILPLFYVNQHIEKHLLKHYDLCLKLVDDTDGYSLIWDYNSRRLDTNRVEGLIHAYAAILKLLSHKLLS